MKILFVDLQYDYGSKNRGINEIGERGFRQVFEKLGHEVECFYYDEYLKNLAQLQVDLLEKARLFRPDLIYFSLFENQFTIETLDKLKKEFKTINWFGDDQWRFESFTKKYANHFSYCITTDPFAIAKYHAMGCENVFLSQWASLDYPVIDEPELSYQYDVSFIGGCNSTRRWFIKELRKKGISVASFGYGWPNGALKLAEMVKVFQTSKISLNLSNSISYDFRYLTSHIKNSIIAYKAPKTASQIKMRNFEIPYYGGFQLTDYVPGLERYLKIGEEVICYRDVDEAAMLIKYYLKNDAEREAVKIKSMRRARNEHTYYHRHKIILECLE